LCFALTLKFAWWTGFLRSEKWKGRKSFCFTVGKSSVATVSNHTGRLFITMHRLRYARNNLKNGNKRLKRAKTRQAIFFRKKALASLDDNILQTFKTIFQKYDPENFGFIVAKDILPIMEELGLPVTNHSVQNIIVEMDADGNGAISFNDFVAVMATKMIFPYPMDKVRAACEMFDDNSNGKLRSEDIRFAMEELVPHPMSHDEASHMINDLFGSELEMDISVFLNRVKTSLTSAGGNRKSAAPQPGKRLMSLIEIGNPK
jgi:Ca2+-binding EF-hand superfamily protein